MIKYIIVAVGSFVLGINAERLITRYYQYVFRHFPEFKEDFCDKYNR